MYNALVSMDSQDKAYFTANYATLNASLYSTYMSKEDAMRAQMADLPQSPKRYFGSTQARTARPLI